MISPRDKKSERVLLSVQCSSHDSTPLDPLLRRVINHYLLIPPEHKSSALVLHKLEYGNHVNKDCGNSQRKTSVLEIYLSCIS